jgi:hypothetical protein
MKQGQWAEICLRPSTAPGAGPAASGMHAEATARPATLAAAPAALHQGQACSGGGRSSTTSSSASVGHHRLTGSEQRRGDEGGRRQRSAATGGDPWGWWRGLNSEAVARLRKGHGGAASPAIGRERRLWLRLGWWLLASRRGNGHGGGWTRLNGKRTVASSSAARSPATGDYGRAGVGGSGCSGVGDLHEGEEQRGERGDQLRRRTTARCTYPRRRRRRLRTGPIGTSGYLYPTQSLRRAPPRAANGSTVLLTLRLTKGSHTFGPLKQILP